MRPFINSTYLRRKYTAFTMSSQEAKIFSLRVPENLKDAFKRTCEARDRTMSQKLRDYMRAYVAEHSEDRQHDIQEELEKLDV